MNTQYLSETVRQQIDHSVRLNKMLLNLNEAIKHRDNISKSEYYSVFGSELESQRDVERAEDLILKCTDAVNREIRILELSKVELLTAAS